MAAALITASFDRLIGDREFPSVSEVILKTRLENRPPTIYVQPMLTRISALNRIVLAGAAVISSLAWTGAGAEERDHSKEKAFAASRTRFLEIYQPIVQQEAALKLEIELTDEVPNYFGGMKIEDGRLVIILGSRSHLEPRVTPDSETALLCHEVGHRIGGPPLKTSGPDHSWSSTEGQCDYFAASLCLKKIFAADRATQTLNYEGIDPSFHRRCAEQATSPEEAKVCLRGIKAGWELIDSIYAIYLSYAAAPPRPNLMTPEADSLSAGMLYPSLQCRLDTFVAGALSKPRPECWYGMSR